MVRAGRIQPGRGAQSPAAALLGEGLDHHRRGRLVEAARAYRRILRLDPRHAHALHLLGLVQHQQGRQAEARELIERALAADGSNAAYHNSLGLVLLAQGEAEAAVSAFRAALARDPTMAEAFNNLGNAEQKAGRLAEAVAGYDRALALAPDNAEALCNKGRALHGLDALGEAAAAYRAALALRPNYAKAWRFLGDALAESGATAEAEDSFRKALALAPGDGETLAALAALEERAGRLEDALVTAERALAAGGAQGAAVAAARCERRLGRAEAAVARLRGVPVDGLDADGRAHLSFELGASLDRAGAYAGAYRAYCEANAFAAETPQARASDRTALPLRVGTLRQRFTPQWVASWTPPIPSGEHDPVFLIGFPRSGTTLLDQVLDAHPGLATMENRAGAGRGSPCHSRHCRGGYPEALAGLDAGEIHRLRRLYFAEAARYVAVPEGARLVDKMPLNTIDAGLIARLFPKAKVLLALRHPCDVSSAASCRRSSRTRRWCSSRRWRAAPSSTPRSWTSGGAAP